MGFTSTGQIVITGWYSTLQIVGPIIPLNTWTHIGSTFSPTNGYRLYVNGTLFNSAAASTRNAPGKISVLTLGNPLQGVSRNYGGDCQGQSIVQTVYSGSIDEFRVYSRELASTEIVKLANP